MPTRSGGAAAADAATKNNQPNRMERSDRIMKFIPCGRLSRDGWPMEARCKSGKPFVGIGQSPCDTSTRRRTSSAGHQERRTSVARVAVTETSTDIQLSTSTTRALRSLRPAAVAVGSGEAAASVKAASGRK